MPCPRQGTLLLLLCLCLALFTGCATLVQSIKNEDCSLDPTNPFDVIRVDLAQAEIRLFWKDDAGNRYGSLSQIQQWAKEHHFQLVAATNAGIFEPGFIPTGLYVEAGQELSPLNLADGYGNFFLKPNGVFFIDDRGASIYEASRFAEARPDVAYATQSGPLLLNKNRVHPAFTDGSRNCRLRSGIGVSPDGSVYLVISNGSVNFYDFAVYFRDQLGVEEALYLDGGISKLLAPDMGRMEDGEFAGILAVLLPLPPP